MDLSKQILVLLTTLWVFGPAAAQEIQRYPLFNDRNASNDYPHFEIDESFNPVRYLNAGTSIGSKQVGRRSSIYEIRRLPPDIEAATEIPDEHAQVAGDGFRTIENRRGIFPNVDSGSIEFGNTGSHSEIDPGQRYFQVSNGFDFELQTSMTLSTVQPIFVTSANQSGCYQDLLSPYDARVERYRAHDRVAGPNLQTIPTQFVPWWRNPMTEPFGREEAQLPISLDGLIQSALRNSPHIQVAATEPHIRQTTVFEESARFDWVSFLETNYGDKNDPIGNTLTTGDNADRFRQHEWSAKGGLRRRNTVGGEFELSQRLGYLDNNSRFLVPGDQGSSRLELNYRQPLLKGRGMAVNESLILLADIDFLSASDDFLENLQAQLVDVTETYWELVRARSEFLQRTNLLQSAEEILMELEGRAEVDAQDRQIFRAKAAVAKRRSEIARSLTSIKNAESRLRLLVNDPLLIDGAGMEFMPLDMPSHIQWPVELADAISTAIIHRPDISKAIRDVSAANVRLGVARNEILPKLDFLVGTYVAGLDGDSDAFNSWVRQFRDGRPGYNVGLEFELPIGNRVSQARQQRSQWESVRSLHQFRAVVETGLTEVEIAVREVKTTHKEIQGRYHAMVAADNETSFLVDRWQTLPGIDDSVTLLLEDLLDSQERLADEEAAYSLAQFDFAVATVRLKQAMGTLFQVGQENNGKH